MFAGNQQQLLAQYNRWMNEKLYAAAAQLTDEQRKTDLRAFFKSIHATFEHLLMVDNVWLRRFRGEAATPSAASGGFAHPDFEALRAVRAACDQQIIAWADALTPEWLAAPYTWHSVVLARTFNMPGFAVVSQFFNHQTHHRGQITTLLKQLGIDPGVTDIPLLPALDE
jgi:uncharacterized damage-inducible protein DinB